MTLNWTVLSGGQAATAGPIFVNVPTSAALINDLAARMDRDAGFAVATLNLDHLVKLRTDAAFAKAYATHSHVTADGNPIVWLLRLVGENIELCPGSELVEPVTRLAAHKQVSIALLGSTQDTLEAATEHLKAIAPGLNVVSCLAPPMGFSPEGADADAFITELRASGAGLVFLALGAPKQELLAARICDALPGVGVLSIGAGLDFLAKTQTRAPTLVRRLALEWLWRLASNPARFWRRYAACIAILPGLVWGALRHRLKITG